MSRLPPFDPIEFRLDITAIPAIPAIQEEQNSGNSNEPHREDGQPNFSNSEGSEEFAMAPEPAVQEDLSSVFQTVEGPPHIPKTRDLLPWASELAEQDLVLSAGISFVETPLRTITTEQVSYFAALYLKTIVRAQSYQHPDRCWGIYTPEWWKQQEQQAFDALAGLKIALEQRDKDIV